MQLFLKSIVVFAASASDLLAWAWMSCSYAFAAFGFAPTFCPMIVFFYLSLLFLGDFAVAGDGRLVAFYAKGCQSSECCPGFASEPCPLVFREVMGCDVP